MRVVILLDRLFARREREMLSRLEISLADEGVRVIHAVPFMSLGQEPIGLYSTVVGYNDRGLSLTRRSRAAQLRDAIARAVEDEDHHDVDVVHALGVPAWRMGMDLAGMLGACVLLELWQGGALPTAASLASHKVGARAPEFAVCEPAMRRALRKRAAHATVHLVPWGVHTPPTVPPPSPPEQPLSVAMLADTGDPTAVTAALTGIARLAERPRGVLVFAGTQDGASGRDSAIWSAARKLGLLDRLSLVADMEARREPILQMDMLVLPEATGRQRTLVLDAMAHGVNVVAAADELSESLVDGSTARLVTSSTADAWTDALRDVAESTEASQRRRETAQDFVRSQRTASGHGGAVMTAYNAMVAAAKVGVPDLARQLS